MLSPIGAIVQRHDPDRFLTASFAPADRRETLLVLYAFNHELARAREVSSVPALALIRLQWWRELVQGAVRRHEVGTAVSAAVAAGRLDRTALLAMIAARELEAEAVVGLAAWRGYLAGAAGGVMAEAGRVLGADGAICAALRRVGAGCGAVGLMRNAAAGRGWARGWGPQGAVDVAEEARGLLGPVRRWPRGVVAAALPAVLARRDLRGVGRGRGAGAGCVACRLVWTLLDFAATVATVRARDRTAARPLIPDGNTGAAVALSAIVAGDPESVRAIMAGDVFGIGAGRARGSRAWLDVAAGQSESRQSKGEQAGGAGHGCGSLNAAWLGG